MAFARYFLVLLLLGLSAAQAPAQAPRLVLAEAPARISLAEHLATARLPLAAPADPDTLWHTPADAAQGAHRLALSTGSRMVGRISLQGRAERATYVLEVPVPSVDEVRVWWRAPGQPWRSAEAGDRIALSRWPFGNQFPAIPISVGPEPVDLLVTAANEGRLRVPVFLSSDPVFRHNGVRRANLSGVVMGLGAMTAIVCVLGAFAMRRRAAWLLAFVSGWALLGIACTNGYMAVWFTPDWPAFNDASKHFTGTVLAGLLAPLVAESLDERHVGRIGRIAAGLVPVLAIVYAAAQAAALPESWRLAGAAAVATLSMACSVALCAVNGLHGGRHLRPVVAALVCLIVAAVLAFRPLDFAAGVDLRLTVMAVLLYSSLLLLRAAQIARERYGRDVLSREAIAADRDPLTALWSFDGFAQRHAEAVLREAAGQGAASMMVLLLPGLEQSGEEHGFVLTERALVRLAARLQRLLGRDWAIGRLSKTRLAAISLRPLGAPELVQTATRVLSQCARLAQPLNPVQDFDLRIVCRHRNLAAGGFKELLREMEEAGRALEPGKRITLL